MRSGEAVPDTAAAAPPRAAEVRRAVLDAVREAGQAAASQGPDAARSQDFLYDEEGLPR